MIKGISIHIGLNLIDKASYGVDGLLAGCENDAISMKELADSLGYTSTIILTYDATYSRVVQEIGKAAKVLGAGDMLFLTYSGHGGQVPDANGDEDDGYDETWCLYDRMLIDDELSQLWSQFGAGVRILALSDSCHSGTVLKSILLLPGRTPTFAPTTTGTPRPKEFFVSLHDNYTLFFGGTDPMRKARAIKEQPPRFRALTPAESMAAYLRHKDLYDAAQWMVPRGRATPLQASLVLISGCQDNQLSSDGINNGLFTEKLLEVWDHGNFSGDYRKLHTEICRRMPPTQTPNYFVVGVADPGFESQRPFEIATSSTTPTGPSVKGPTTWPGADDPPSFSVVTGANKYYIFEICNGPELFDYVANGSQRTEENFYGSYNDSERFTGPSYKLPGPVWEKLSTASDKLYYRIGTTSSKDKSEGWDNYQVSTQDNEGEKAPFLTVV